MSSICYPYCIDRTITDLNKRFVRTAASISPGPQQVRTQEHVQEQDRTPDDENDKAIFRTTGHGQSRLLRDDQLMLTEVLAGTDGSQISWKTGQEEKHSEVNNVDRVFMDAGL